MNARLRHWCDQLSESFWLVPAGMVLLGIGLALALLEVDRQGWVPVSVGGSSWLYNGGGTGARTLLGAIVSSTIGVAGTVFSITIAALSLAAGQMGPRLLRNFTRDRGNQCTLGAFLGTFSYALTVLRSVRTQQEGAFTPHVALSFGMVLAFVCVAVLVYFVGHMASRINVDTVIDLVSDDVTDAFAAVVVEDKQAKPAMVDDERWAGATVVRDQRSGYLQQLDAEQLARWASEQGASMRLLVRRCDYIAPGAPIALVMGKVEGAADAIVDASALGGSRGSRGDAEQTVRQLVEVAVRALSPGINDPHTAMSVLDRLGAALCGLAGKALPSGVHVKDGQLVLVVPVVSYESLCAVMFHMIRQNSEGTAALLIKLADVLTVVLSAEPDPARQRLLAEHIALVEEDAERSLANASDLGEVRRRVARFRALHAAQGTSQDMAMALLTTR